MVLWSTVTTQNTCNRKLCNTKYKISATALGFEGLQPGARVQHFILPLYSSGRLRHRQLYPGVYGSCQLFRTVPIWSLHFSTTNGIVKNVGRKCKDLIWIEEVCHWCNTKKCAMFSMNTVTILWFLKSNKMFTNIFLLSLRPNMVKNMAHFFYTSFV